MKIVQGPNGNFYIALLIFGGLSLANRSWMPIGVFAAIMLISIPLSIWGHKWEQKMGAKMLADFPHDPAIQMKYAKYKKEQHGS